MDDLKPMADLKPSAQMIYRLTEALAVKGEMIDKLLAMSKEKDMEQKSELQGQNQIIQDLERLVNQKVATIHQLQQQLQREKEKRTQFDTKQLNQLRDEIKHRDDAIYTLNQKWIIQSEQHQKELRESQRAVHESNDRMLLIQKEVQEALTLMDHEKNELKTTMQIAIDQKETEIQRLLKLQKEWKEKEVQHRNDKKLITELRTLFGDEKSRRETLQQAIEERDAIIQKLQRSTKNKQKERDLITKLQSELDTVRRTQDDEMKRIVEERDLLLQQVEQDMVMKNAEIALLKESLSHRVAVQALQANLNSKGQENVMLEKTFQVQKGKNEEPNHDRTDTIQFPSRCPNIFVKGNIALDEKAQCSTEKIKDYSHFAEIQRIKESTKGMSAERIRKEKQRDREFLEILKRVKDAEHHIFGRGSARVSTVTDESIREQKRRCGDRSSSINVNAFHHCTSNGRQLSETQETSQSVSRDNSYRLDDHRRNAETIETVEYGPTDSSDIASRTLTISGKSMCSRSR